MTDDWAIVTIVIVTIATINTKAYMFGFYLILTCETFFRNLLLIQKSKKNLKPRQKKR